MSNFLSVVQFQQIIVLFIFFPLLLHLQFIFKLYNFFLVKSLFSSHFWVNHYYFLEFFLFFFTWFYFNLLFSFQLSVVLFFITKIFEFGLIFLFQNLSSHFFHLVQFFVVKPNFCSFLKSFYLKDFASSPEFFFHFLFLN